MEILTAVRRRRPSQNGYDYEAVWTDLDTEVDRIEVCEVKRASQLRAIFAKTPGVTMASALLNLQLIEQESIDG